jgi:non-ribosomal peptide synthetase component F
MLEHRGLGNLASYSAEVWGVGPESRVLQFATASFDASVMEYAQAFGQGAALVLATRDEVRSWGDLTAVIRKQEVSHTLLPPALLRANPAEPLPSLVNLTGGGDAVPREVVDSWAPGRTFNNAYGPTEITVTATIATCAAGDVNPPAIGLPLPNVTTYVVDRRGHLAPLGVAGELWVGGAGVARGYINRPELTAAAFLPDPFQPGGRVYRTGDLVRWRADGMIESRSRGFHSIGALFGGAT